MGPNNVDNGALARVSPSKTPEPLESQRPGLGSSYGVEIDAQISTLSSNDSFPEDILREIFWLCLPLAHNSTFSPRDAPLLLTHICRRWRDVALSMPSLWRSLHIPLGSTPPHLEFPMDEWLARAGAMPLSISFGSPTSDDLPTPSHLIPYFRKLQQTPKTLETLSFALQDKERKIQDFVAELSRTGANPMQLVSKLTVHIDPLDPYNHIRGLGDFSTLGLHENHNLRVLKFSAVYHLLFLPEVPDISVPWINLRVLDLQTQNFYRGMPMTIRTGFLLSILSWCPKLVELKAFSAGNLMASESQNVALNPELRHASLLLVNLQSMGYVDFLAKCDWPLLTSLHLGTKGRSGPNPERVYILHQILEKWESRLMSLRFTYPFVRRKHLLYFLSQLPSLIQLHIEDGVIQRIQVGAESDEDSDCEDDGPGAQDEVIASLTPGSNEGLSEHSCPHLQYFRWDGRARFSDKAVINFISNRALSPTSPVRLKQVVINFKRGAQDDIGAACSGLVREGLKLNLAYNVLCIDDLKQSGPYRGLAVDENPLEMGWM